jgi:hypothetical protein
MQSFLKINNISLYYHKRAIFAIAFAEKFFEESPPAIKFIKALYNLPQI